MPPAGRLIHLDTVGVTSLTQASSWDWESLLAAGRMIEKTTGLPEITFQELFDRDPSRLKLVVEHLEKAQAEAATSPAPLQADWEALIAQVESFGDVVPTKTKVEQTPMIHDAGKMEKELGPYVSAPAPEPIHAPLPVTPAQARKQQPVEPKEDGEVDLLGLTDNAEITKIIGLPIDTTFDEVVKVLETLKDAIGLPVGHDANAQAERLQVDHYHIQRAMALLELAIADAEVNYEAWFETQAKANFDKAMEHHATQMARYKAKEIEKPEAPLITVIKGQIKASVEAVAYRKAINRLSYWRSIVKQVGSEGHNRKAMLMMNLNNADPQAKSKVNATGAAETSKMGSGEIKLGADDLEAVFKEKSPTKVSPPKSELDELPPPGEKLQEFVSSKGNTWIIPAKGPERAPGDKLHGLIDPGLAELYPWLRSEGPSPFNCIKCNAAIYHLDKVYYNVDKTPHNCEDKAIPADDFSLGIDLSQIGGSSEPVASAPPKTPDPTPAQGSSSPQPIQEAKASPAHGASDDFFGDLNLEI